MNSHDSRSRHGAGRIDVHAHYVPERYRRALEAAGHGKPSGMPAIPEWSVGTHLAMMDRLRIDASLLSISAPGIHFGDDVAARELARHCNEAGAQVVRDHPTRFGLFAVLPLPDVEGALSEMRYAFDELNADGVVMETNFHGKHLGDPAFEAVFAELNRRNGTLFVHPTDPYCACCQRAEGGEQAAPTFPYPMLEFMFETARAVFNLMLSGTLDRYPDIRIIVPHAGATVPVLAERVAGFAAALRIGTAQQHNPAHFHATLRKLYFDLAGLPEPAGLAALLQVADSSRVLYGSDWPFTPAPIAEKLAETLEKSRQIPPSLLPAFMRENALTLFPRFASV